jgi:hypothetical protein
MQDGGAAASWGKQWGKSRLCHNQPASRTLYARASGRGKGVDVRHMFQGCTLEQKENIAKRQKIPRGLKKLPKKPPKKPAQERSQTIKI